jgi:hypothetical protein
MRATDQSTHDAYGYLEHLYFGIEVKVDGIYDESHGVFEAFLVT